MLSIIIVKSALSLVLGSANIGTDLTYLPGGNHETYSGSGPRKFGEEAAVDAQLKAR